MKSFRLPRIIACLAALIALGIGTPSLAQELPGEMTLAVAEVTATVKAIDHETRAVTLQAADGEEYSFIASDEVRNLAQVKQGDLVTVMVTEALAWEVRKGGEADLTETVAGGRASPGERPAGLIAHEVVVTVEIIEIDREAPSVTFRGPAGGVRTIAVRYPERLEGVNVGDTVEITYTEALAIRVDPAQ